MNVVIDMNLSPDWVLCLTAAGINAVHWSTIGPADAPDHVIMKWAEENQHVVFTHDLDFGTLLHLTGARRPSVIQLRAEDVRPGIMGDLVRAALQLVRTELESGALVTIDPRKNRLHLLPLKKN